MAYQNKPLETAGRTPSGRLLESLGSTEQDLSTRSPFSITGKSLRLTYETTDTVQSGVPFLDVTVLDQRGKEVYSQVLFEEGVMRKVVHYRGLRWQRKLVWRPEPPDEPHPRGSVE